MPLRSEFFKELLDSMSDGVYLTDAERRVTFWNRGAEAITGYAAGEVVGKSSADNLLNHVDGDGNPLCAEKCPLEATIRDGEIRQAEVFLHHKDGYRVPVLVRTARITGEGGEVLGGVEIFSDSSPKVSATEQVRMLENLAYKDPLTELPNRRFTERALESSLNEIRRNGWLFGVLLLDLDRFEEVNEKYGHDAGDKALRMVARVLGGSCRSFDVVGRWGGEEFLAVIKHVDEQKLRATAEKFRALVEQSALTLGGEEVRITLSAGGIVAGLRDTPESLVERAAEKLEEGKRAGRNRVTI